MESPPKKEKAWRSLSFEQRRMLKSRRVIVLILAAASSVTCGTPTVRATSDKTPDIPQMSAVERVVSDGQDAPAALKSQAEKNILTLDNNTVSCSLPEGDTTFVISLVRSSPLDRFTLINENLAARGELRIAVSNEKLSADSDKWTPVDGAVSFKRKRLFNVSMLGVEAKYIRLTFHVEHQNDMAARGRQGLRIVSRRLESYRLRDLGHPIAARGVQSFSISLLAEDFALIKRAL